MPVEPAVAQAHDAEPKESEGLPLHTPAEHTSPVVLEFPSSHAAPSGRGSLMQDEVALS